jgi:hypothetical protein
MGRWPRKGTGIKIFAPSFRRVGTFKEEDEEKGIFELCGFHLTTVFDVADTEGEELPPIHQYWVEESEEGEGLYQALWQVALGMDIQVGEAHLGQTGGVSYGGRVAVNADNPLLARTSSLAHEVAHELLHQGGNGQDLDRQTRELEAESVAYVVCAHFGYEVKAPEYIALWHGDSERVLARLESIRKAASTIIQGIEAALQEVSSSTEAEAVAALTPTATG